jgi:DNA polymerase-3 subunit delta
VAKSSASADAHHALDFLAEKSSGPVPAVVAVFGDESFLKRLVLAELKRRTASVDDAEFSFVELEGDEASPRDVFDELSTLSLFGGGRRVVIVDDADKFVTNNRERLEDYAAKPASGVLVLDVGTWQSNTRLYKAVAALGGNIHCSAPGEAALLKWLIAWAKERYQAKLPNDAAEMLVDLVGDELGLLDQELAKLASAAGTGPITCELVQQFVGSWRTKTGWDMIDAAVEGRAADAIAQLDRLVAAGEHPVALLAQMASTLRRFAAATRLLEEAERSGRRVSARPILQQAGFKPFVLDKAERQWRQLGRRRTGSLYSLVLETDLALKGRMSSASRSRLALEELVARLSQDADVRKKSG